MNVSPHTVKFRLQSVLKKLDANNGRYAILKAAARGIIQLEEEDGARKNSL